MTTNTQRQSTSKAHSNETRNIRNVITPDLDYKTQTRMPSNKTESKYAQNDMLTSTHNTYNSKFKHTHANAKQHMIRKHNTYTTNFDTCNTHKHKHNTRDTNAFTQALHFEKQQTHTTTQASSQ